MKNKGILITLILIGAINSLNAQVNIMLNEPIAQSLKLSNVFNFTLLQTNQSTYSFKWFGKVFRNNQLVASGSSQLINVNQLSFQANNSSGSFNYTNINLAGQSLNGDLPFGNYRFCVEVHIFIDGVQEQDIEDCYDKEYTPMSPPFLITPENNEIINIPNPLLVWSPPMPILNDASLRYRLKLVEILPNQTALAAIQSNLALLDVDNLSQTNLLYPLNAPSLINGKEYAWRISTKTANYNFGNTETWTFKYQQPNIDTASGPSEPYIVVSKALNSEFQTKDGFLYVQFDEKYNTSELLFKVFNSSNQEVNISCSAVPSKRQGDNRLKFDFKLCNSLPKGRYKIEFYESNNNIQSIFFVYE